MSEASRKPLNTILASAAVVEVDTGLVWLIDPALVVAMLLGANESGGPMPLGRVAGVALLALGMACWPGRQNAECSSPATRGMLVYNALIALYLTYVGTAHHLGGPLLWPGVALHAVVVLLLLWRAYRKRAFEKTNQ